MKVQPRLRADDASVPGLQENASHAGCDASNTSGQVVAASRQATQLVVPCEPIENRAARTVEVHEDRRSGVAERERLKLVHLRPDRCSVDRVVEVEQTTVFRMSGAVLLVSRLLLCTNLFGLCTSPSGPSLGFELRCFCLQLRNLCGVQFVLLCHFLLLISIPAFISPRLL